MLVVSEYANVALPASPSVADNTKPGTTLDMVIFPENVEVVPTHNFFAIPKPPSVCIDPDVADVVSVVSSCEITPAVTTNPPEVIVTAPRRAEVVPTHNFLAIPTPPSV